MKALFSNSVRTVAVLLLVLVSGYALVPWVLEGLARYRLQTAGFAVATLEAGYPKHDHILITGVALEMDLPGGLARLEFDEVRVDYSLPGLLDQRITGVTFSPGRLDFSPPVRPYVQTAVRWPLPGEWIGHIPLEHVRIPELAVSERDDTGIIRAAVLAGGIERNDRSLAGRFELVRDGRGLAALELELDSDGHMLLELRDPATSAPPVLGLRLRLLAAANDRVSFSGELSCLPAQLLALWNPVANGPEGTVSASIEGSASAIATTDFDRLLNTLHGKAAVDLDLTAGRLDGIGSALALQLASDLQFADGAAQMVLRQDARFSGLLDMLDPGSRFATQRQQRSAPVTVVVSQGASLTATLHGTAWRFDIPAGVTMQVRDTLLRGYSIPLLTLRSLPGSVAVIPGGRELRARMQWSASAERILTPFAELGELRRLSGTVQFDTGSQAARIGLQDVGLDMLGGRLGIASLQVGPGGTVNPFEVNVEGLDLARVVALERRGDLEAAGLLDGILPFVITADGASVRAGRLDARAPGGVIRYRPGTDAGALAGGNASLKLVYQALSNLHYDRLGATIDYHPDGRLLLAATLTGRNPDWNGGQAVNLNLNIEDNVLQLLESLYAGERLGKQFEQMVQERYRSQRQSR